MFAFCVEISSHSWKWQFCWICEKSGWKCCRPPTSLYIVEKERMEYISFENDLASNLGWPQWALRTIATLFTGVCLLFFVELIFTSSSTSSTQEVSNEKKEKINNASFAIFQVQYLAGKHKSVLYPSSFLTAYTLPYHLFSIHSMTLPLWLTTINI